MDEVSANQLANDYDLESDAHPYVTDLYGGFILTVVEGLVGYKSYVFREAYNNDGVNQSSQEKDSCTKFYVFS